MVRSEGTSGGRECHNKGGEVYLELEMVYKAYPSLAKQDSGITSAVT